MSISAIITKFIQDFQLSTWQEWVSTISQIISVYFAQKNSVLVYPTGMIGVLLAAWMYYFVADPPLYADTVLNIYYFAMSIYGLTSAIWHLSNSSLLLVRFCTLLVFVLNLE